MDIAGFGAWAGISEAKVQDLLARGLPINADGQIDPYVAADWIEKSGIGKRTQYTGVVKTQGEVAKAFGVAQGTVRKEWRPSGMPGQTGRWDLAEIFAWKSARGKNPTHPADTSGDGLTVNEKTEQRDLYSRRLAAEVRRKEAEARKKEREDSIAAGGIVHRDNVDREVSSMIVAARSALKRIPREMMPRFPQNQATELAGELERRIDRVLETMANWRPNYEDDT